MKMKHYLRALVVVGCVGVTLAGPPPEIAGPLKTIRSVGPEGHGNAAASAAWKQLAAGNAASLVPILEAMDGANDYALNWLRGAVDAIAGRELDAGGKLPLPALGKFLLETRHHPRARRLAFELIARVDAATTDKLLAGMLNDPSLEIRRDAVQKVISQGNGLVTDGNPPGATLLYQQALNCARDVKQIESLAKKLADLGQPVDLLKHFGFIANWKIIGPFDNAGNRGFTNALPPEQKLDLAGEYDGKAGKVRWQDHVTTDKYGMVDMNQPLGRLKEVTAYATTEFFSGQAQPVELRLGGKNSWKLWLNGKLLFERDEYHANQEIDQYLMPTQLQPGRNVILVKVCQNEEVKEWTGEWEFQLRVTDALGTPIVSAGDANEKLKDN
ncbi:MAG: hypothetical protein EXS35_09125 [Pedosphaera sp.]|nr:hypothetical protein [Pedosphaera sp.]